MNSQETKNKKAKVLRTYTTDMAEAIREDEISVIKIALAEKARREKEEEEKKAKGTGLTRAIFFLGGIVLLALAGAVIYFFFIKDTEEPPVPVENKIDTFLTFDDKTFLDITKIENINQLKSSIGQELNNLSGQIKIIFFTRTMDEQKEIAPISSLFSLAKIEAPNSLTRVLSNNYLFGRYNSFGEHEQEAPFFILETTDYNQAYISMLNWEETMLEDFYLFFEVKLPEGKTPYSYRRWNDVIIKNKDVRVIKDEYGKNLLFYSFVNKNNFVITTDIKALEEIIGRILAKNI